MRKTFSALTVILLVAVLLAGCHKGSRKIATAQDSLSYIIGLNVGHNLMHMDSTLSADAVCAAIRDVFAHKEKMTMEEARYGFLKQTIYDKYEKMQRYEEQFLQDLASSGRNYVRTQSGVTYNIVKLGDQNRQSLYSRDTVTLVRTISDSAGKQVVARDTVRQAFGDLVGGLQEVVRITGSGGKVDAWLPAATAYGSAGDPKQGIQPNQMLHYNVDIVGISQH